jgi:hypothetical protein
VAQRHGGGILAGLGSDVIDLAGGILAIMTALPMASVELLTFRASGRGVYQELTDIQRSGGAGQKFLPLSGLRTGDQYADYRIQALPTFPPLRPAWL